MAKYKKSIQQLASEFKDQLSALRASNAGYDGGSLWEAKRLATSMYILFHDGGNNKSITGILNIKGKLKLLSSVVERNYPTGSTVLFRSPHNIVSVSMGPSGVTCIPNFDITFPMSSYKWVNFAKWWEEKVIDDGQRTSLSRKNIIFSMRNQDGGAHTDPDLKDESYSSYKHIGVGTQILSHHSSGLQSGPTPIPNLIDATVRQISWEVDQSFEAIGY
jgi:hypothetical protein